MAIVHATAASTAVTGNTATATIGVNAAVSASFRSRPARALLPTPPAAIRARACSMYRSTPDTYEIVIAPAAGVGRLAVAAAALTPMVFAAAWRAESVEHIGARRSATLRHD